MADNKIQEEARLRYPKVIGRIIATGDLNDYRREAFIAGAVWQKGQNFSDLPAGFYFIDKNGKKYYSDTLKCGNLKFIANQKEQKPVDGKEYSSPECSTTAGVWSEEDEDMLNSCISSIEEAKENRYAYKETDGDTSYDREINWLKSLRNGIFQNGNTHWKPTEDEERLINTSISFLKDFADKGYENAVECIDWLKSKLNGNTGK